MQDTIRLRLATGDYAFWAEADDLIERDNSEKLKALIASLSIMDPSPATARRPVDRRGPSLRLPLAARRAE